MNPKERTRGLKEQKLGQIEKKKKQKVSYKLYTISTSVKYKGTKQSNEKSKC